LTRKPIKRVSSKQAKKNRTWSALKLARIKARIDAQGWVGCEHEGCGVAYGTIENARAYLEPHHAIQKSLCGEYTDENLKLYCNSHHNYWHSAEGLREARGVTS